MSLKKLCTALLACACLHVAHAQPASNSQIPSLEELFKQPTLADVTLSVSGKYLAATAPNRGRMNLVVIDLETRKGTLLTSFEDFDVIGVRWVEDERLLFSLGQRNSPTGPGNFDGGGLFVINRDGSSSRRLAQTTREMRNSGQTVFRRLAVYRTLPGNTNEIIASGNLTSAESTDLYKLNLNNGRTELLTSGRPANETFAWMLDSKLVPRVVTAGIKDELTSVVYYRKDANSPWEEIARYSRDKGNVFVPLAFESDDRIMQVATNKGRDTMAVFRYDPDKKELGEQIAAHPRYDMGADSQGARVPGAIWSFRENKILGYSVDGDKPEVVWIDEARARTQKTLDASLPDTINGFERTPDGKKFLVSSYSDTKPTRWYMYDEAKKTLEEIGAAAPWLDGKLVQQRPMRYKTRDGLEIPGYLFLPKNYKEGSKLPFVVHIHGGPHVRADSFADGRFGYREAQALASRGYGVLLPNFRVTPGFGQKIYQAGFGAIGRQMSEDHEDATKWAIDAGYADPKRICISGASYGGYASLQALAKTPEMFKCAVAGLAVTDFKYQLTTPDGDSWNNSRGQQIWKAIVGVKSWDEQLVRDISPVNYANKIKGAVFLYAGQDDVRVPIDQINRMDKALKAAGNPAKAYVVKEKEGHGFGRTENNVDLYTQVLKFLDEQIGK
jgi:dipeptidyl aminopeptidase/acylaminoacyl peptidase